MSKEKAKIRHKAPAVGVQRPCSAFVVGLPDTRGYYCWLAGFKNGDPARYYSPHCALRFKTRYAAECAIIQARATHPTKQRTYVIVPVAEMALHMEPNASHQATASE